MSPEDAESISEQLLRPARADSARRQARVERRKQAFSRLATGAAALFGYYLGFRLMLSVTESPIMQQSVAVAIGLLAAVFWGPARK